MINFLTPVSPNTKFIESKIESAYLTINNIYNQYNHAVLIIDMTIFPYKKEWQVFHQTVDKNNAKKNWTFSRDTYALHLNQELRHRHRRLNQI